MKNDILYVANINKLNPECSLEKGCAIAIGGFDGVHIGHRAMIEKLVSEAKSKGVPAAIFTFNTDDSPKETFKLLASDKQKAEIFSMLGVDIVISVPFSEIKNISASDFAKSLFCDFSAKSVICGYDFRFGKNREGDVSLIKERLSPLGVNIVTPKAVCFDGKPISSTSIRTLISEGRIAKANELLGREFSFSSEVVCGIQLARELGFPTANQVYPENLVLPRFGVYATEIIIDEKNYRGISNIGVKPTFGGNEKPLCETYIFDFCGDCYGKTALIRFVDFIRTELKFNSKEELSAQIKKDQLSAIEKFSERGK